MFFLLFLRSLRDLKFSQFDQLKVNLVTARKLSKGPRILRTLNQKYKFSSGLSMSVTTGLYGLEVHVT